MKNRSSIACLALLPLILAGCSSNVQSMDVRNYYNQNPLAREETETAFGQVMVNMIVGEKAELQKNDLFNEVDRMRLEAGKRIEEATKERKNGLLGQFVPHKQRTAGFVLLRPKEGVIFTGTTFESDPGPDLHLYGSTVQDPRSEAFPDTEAKDLGTMGFTYGALTMHFDPKLWNNDFRTLILYDKKLKRVYGFAQLSPQI